MLKKTTGFTLIELMITLSIIAIISAVGFATYRNSQMVARDGRRKQDLKAISTALFLYRQQNGRYPCMANNTGHSTTANWIVDSQNCGNTSTISFGTNFINILPTDPLRNETLNINTDTYGYYYVNSAATGGTCPALSGGTQNSNYFQLFARLENPNDPDRCEIKQYTRCDGAVWCNPANQYVNRIIVVGPQ